MIPVKPGSTPLRVKASQQTLRAVRDMEGAKRLVSSAGNYLVLGLVGLLMALPFLAMLSQSLKATTEYLHYPFEWIPSQPTLNNYRLLFTNSRIFRWTANSFLIAGGVVLIQLLTCSLAAYGFARKRFLGRDMIFWLLMLQLILPYQVTIIPVFLLLSRLHLTNTFLAFWLPFGTNVFGTFLLRQAFVSVPTEYDEAARVEGANDFQIYWHVLLPLIRPTLVVLAVFTFISQWNDFLWPLIIIQSDEMKTLQIGLAQLQPIGGEPGVMMAGATYSFLPTFILFLLLQRYIVMGLQSGGLKG